MKLHTLIAALAAALFLSACSPDNIVLGTPKANAGANKAIVEGNTISITGSGSDDDGSIVSYQWSQISGPQVTLLNADTATVSFEAPSVNSTSDVVLQLTVTDNEGKKGSDTVTVTITNNLAAPTVNAGEDRVVDETSLVNLNGNATDNDGNVVSQSWEQIDENPSVSLQDNGDGTASFTAPTVSTATTYTFRYVATDDDGLSAHDDLEVVVTPVIIAPIADAGDDQTVNTSDTVTLDGTSSNDPDGSITGYQWVQVGDNTITITDADQPQATFIAPDAASNLSYTFQLTVTDDDNQTHTDQVSVTVVADASLPIADAGTAQTVQEPADPTTLLTVSLNGANSSAASGIDTYSWELTDTIPAIPEHGTTISLDNPDSDTPSFTLVDIHRDTQFVFTLTVTDTQGNTATDTVVVTATKYLEPRNRYAHNNQCYLMYSTANEQYVTLNNGNYTATALEPEDATPVWLRPAALGKYIAAIDSGVAADGRARRLLFTNTTTDPIQAASFGTTALDDATEEQAVFTLIGAGDQREYPPTPVFHEEPTNSTITTYRNFVESTQAQVDSTGFTLALGSNQRVVVGTDDVLTFADATGAETETFHFERTDRACVDFPEATSNTSGETFEGTVSYTDAAGETKDIVLGHADVHVHVSSNNFLGMTQWGRTFHPLGVTHALDDCDEFHGPTGEQDTVGQLFSEDYGPHDTTGWPTFPLWPAAGLLTHEAIYWTWLERAWLGGQRILVNDLVDNETLCELQRPSSPEPDQDCNAMNNVGKQVGTMYGMQDYIDAQYGGPGMGWFRIVLTPEEAREVAEAGKLAVVFGIEISNFIDCKVTYNPNPLRKAPFEEPGSGPGENTWGCTMEPQQSLDSTADAMRALPDNHVDKQLQRMWDLGVRQIISIHEFDNALGGNGIFDGLVLNFGNRENSGGIPVGGVDTLRDPTTGATLNEDPFGPGSSDGTGEFWTTYTCPQTPDKGDLFAGSTFRGYFGGGGERMPTVANNAPDFPEPPEEFPDEIPSEPPIDSDDAPDCAPYQGHEGRPGGPSTCYPSAKQCNARLMTPIGLYTYARMMEFGFIFDIDHMEIGMKTQALIMSEAQTPPYPIVSTHGSFGGTTTDQAERIYKTGGYIFPPIGGAHGYKNDVNHTRGVWEAAASTPENPTNRVNIFALGYGTDTNGLSGQAGSRGDNQQGANVSYPFELYGNHDHFGQFPALAALFGNTNTMTFEQPSVHDNYEGVGRDWNIDVHGSAQYGMLADLVEELNLEAVVNDDFKASMEALFLSAEAYLQTWTKTIESRDGIVSRGGVDQGALSRILRPAARPKDSLNATDLDDPAINHFDVWGTENDPYEASRPPAP